MPIQRRALVVLHNAAGEPSSSASLAELNALLADGWQVTNMAPMGGGPGGGVGYNFIWFASLVIVEKASA